MSANSESIWDAIILGAGISGLVSANILHRQGLKRILVIDEYDWIGGNHIHCHIGPYTFDIGALIFQDTSPLLGHFPELRQIYHPVTIVSGRIAPDGSQRHYPFSFRDEILAAGLLEWIKLLASVIWARLPPASINNAEEYSRYWLGRRLYEKSGLSNYIERFHGATPSEIEKVFAEKRMSAVANSASIRKQLGRMLNSKKLADAPRQYVRPRDGFDKLYQKAAESLRRKGTSFALGKELCAVSREGKWLRVKATELDAISPRVIVTIPLEKTLQLCGFSRPNNLPTAMLVSLFLSFAGQRSFESNILFNFSNRGRWKRITCFPISMEGWLVANT
jgi:protoporphyrinogen oxidase